MTIVRRLGSFLFGALLAVTCAAQTAPADKDYPSPSHPIRLVVPFPPGGAVDTLARKLGEDLRKRLNATVIVDNRPGAGTIIGTDLVAKSPADGYTLLINAPAGLVQVPWLQKVPYDPIKDLQPIGVVANVPVALIVPTTLKVNSFSEFVAYAKSHQGKMTYASLGNGSTVHIFGEILSSKLNAGAVHVPYKGDSPAMVDVIAGRVDFMFNNVLSSINFSERGNVKILAVTGDKRIPALRDVPTLSELGMQEFDLVGWFSIFAPAGIPRPIAEKISAALREACKTKEFTNYLVTMGLGPADTGIDQFTKQVGDEYVKWGKLIKSYNIQL